MDTVGSHGEDRDAAAKWRATGPGGSICPRHLRDASLYPKQKSDLELPHCVVLAKRLTCVSSSATWGRS